MPLRLVALHAFPLDSRMWGFLAEAGARGELGPGVAVVTPDFRGRAGASRPGAEVHAMSLLAGDVLEDLGSGPGAGEPFVLLGLSMGGYVTLEALARLGPELRPLLRGVVLCDTRAGADDEAGRKKRLEVAASVLAGGMGPLVEAQLPLFLAPPSRGGAAEALVRRMMTETVPATAAADQRGMSERVDRFDVLGSLAVPLLVVVGEEDVLTRPEEAERMAEAASSSPSVSLSSIPGAAHLAPLERPDLFLPDLLAFLDRCRKGPSA